MAMPKFMLYKQKESGILTYVAAPIDERGVMSASRAIYAGDAGDAGVELGSKYPYGDLSFRNAHREFIEAYEEHSRLVVEPFSKKEIRVFKEECIKARKKAREGDEFVIR